MSVSPGPDRDRPQLRRLKAEPELGMILDMTERFLGARSRFSKAAAIFVSHKNTGHSLKKISDFYQMSVSGVCDSYRRIRKELNGNKTLSRAIEEIEGILFGAD